MRKWMRDRMRRRKKPAESAKSGAASLPPLQPSFADASFPPPAPVPQPPPPDQPPATAGPPAEAGSSATGEVSPRSRAPGTAQPKRRRRRGRGGRGRSRQASAPLQPAHPGDTVAPEPSAARAPAAPAQEPPSVAHAGPAPAAGQAARSSKGTVVLAIGLPGSGKSTWFKRREVTPLSSDLVRTLLFDNVTEQRYQDLVFSTLRALLRARLVARMPLSYVDATNLSVHDRRGWIKMARDFGYDVQAVFFDVPLEVCLDRNRRRDRIVPEDVMQRMAAKLRPPAFEEGFSKITVVRVKARDADREPNE
jgi:predicted kinase